MARRRREAYRGLWVLCVCAAGLHGTLGQTCGSEYISWPREQCTQECPNADSMKCGYDATMLVEIADTLYCCVCVPNLEGRYSPMLCPGSALPRPPQQQVSYNGTISRRASEVTVHVPAGLSLTSFVDIAPDFILKGPYDYFELSVWSVAQISNASDGPGQGAGAAAANAGNSSGTRAPRTYAPAPSTYQVLSAQERKAEQRAAPMLRSSEAVLWSGAGWPRYPLYAVRGLHGGRPMHLWTDQEVRTEHAERPRHPSSDALRARRSGAPGHWLEWYVQQDVPPQLVAAPTPYDALPFFLFKGRDRGRIPLLKPAGNSDAQPAANPRLVMGMRGQGAAYRVSVKASIKTAVLLRDGVSIRVSLEPNERAFTYFRPHESTEASETATFQQGVVFLDIKVDHIKNASLRVFVGMNFLSTARKWSQWVGGTDAELNAVPDRFYTSSLMVVPDGDDYASWTIESSKQSNLVLTPRAVQAEPLTPETPREFVISEEFGMALFMLKPTANKSRVFFQLMPSRQRGSREAYTRWEDLQSACRIMAVTKVNGEWAYFQLSDWGYTTDGTPGLQVMISQWDYGATMYLHVYLRRTAPNPAFTVVCYVVDDAFESWRWWFGGIFFALIFFCVARCILGRSPQGNYFGGGRRGAWGRRDMGGMGVGEGGGMELQQALPRVVATTTESPPSKLMKVGDTLYSRPGTDTQVSAGVAAPVGPMFVGMDNTDDDTDASCSICMDRAPDAVLLECGHGGVCILCAQSLWNSGADGRLCPLCRKPITGIVRIISEAGSEVNVEVVHYSQAPAALERRPSSAPPSLMRRLSGGFIVGRSSAAAPGAPAAPVLVEVRNEESTNAPASRRPNF